VRQLEWRTRLATGKQETVRARKVSAQTGYNVVSSTNFIVESLGIDASHFQPPQLSRDRDAGAFQEIGLRGNPA
jgi:hypothetical protein